MTNKIFILLFTFLWTLYISCPSDKRPELRTDTLLKEKFAILTNNARKISDTISFRLDTLTNFSWDSMFIITPYFSVEYLEKWTKVDLTIIKNAGIESRDEINVLAFVKNGSLVNYVELPRNNGDFSAITNKNRIVKRDSCLFELVRTHNEFTTGEEAVEVGRK